MLEPVSLDLMLLTQNIVLSFAPESLITVKQHNKLIIFLQQILVQMVEPKNQH